MVRRLLTKEGVMKKILLITLLVLLVPVLSLAANCTNGSLTQSEAVAGSGKNQVSVITATWAASAGGAVSGTANCQIPIDGYILMVVTDPLADAPTDDYDIVLNDQYGVDVMEGNLNNRDTANTEQTMPAVGGVGMPRFVDSYVALVISNAGDANDGVIYIYVYREK